MKKLFTLLLAFSFATGIFSQAPEKMSYQAVVRGATNELIINQEVGMQISILQGSESGTAVYVETQTPTTNGNGLVSIEIGTGAVVSGDFTTIDWANGTYFIKTETDPDGGSNYSITGTSQLLSVPYALHSGTSDVLTGEITESQISDLQTYYPASNPDGFISDYTVTEEDVSFHQGALEITESQITDLDHFTTADETDPAVAANFDFTDAATGDLLQFDGTKWVKVTPDYISDYTVTEDDVTAHEAALTVTESQITDLGIYIETETDPTFTSSQAANIDAGDITNLGNLSGTNTGDQDLSTLALKTNVLELDNTTAFTPVADYEPATKKYVDDNAGGGSTTYSVGDFAQGGIVFWVDETGQHGLVAAKEDQSTGVRWYAGTYGVTRATGDGPFSGELNTAIIISSQVSIGDDGDDYAAQICNDLQVTEGGKTYGDWYLPSEEELNLMYQNKAIIDATAGANGGSSFGSEADYWSSTERMSSHAWMQLFANGWQCDFSKDSFCRVRAVRAF